MRKDFLHKTSFELVDENQVIYLEDLNVKGIIKNRCLSKSINAAINIIKLGQGMPEVRPVEKTTPVFSFKRK